MNATIFRLVRVIIRATLQDAAGEDTGRCRTGDACRRCQIAAPRSLSFEWTSYKLRGVGGGRGASKQPPSTHLFAKTASRFAALFSRAVLQDRTDDGRETAAHAFTDDREQDRARHQYGAHHQYIVTCCAISKSSASSPRRVSLRRKKITKKSRRPPAR